MTLTCGYCGVEFERPHTRGPVPKWCSDSHRQQAWVKARLQALQDRIAALEAELSRQETQ